MITKFKIFENNNKFEVGDICFLKIGSGNNPLYWKVMITGKGREADEFGPSSNNGYRYKNLEFNGQGWSSRVDAFVKEKPEPKRIFSPEDPYGEEDWENESIDHSDVDPYGEEDWDEPINFKIGDIIRNSIEVDNYAEILDIRDCIITLGDDKRTWDVNGFWLNDWISTGLCKLETPERN